MPREGKIICRYDSEEIQWPDMVELGQVVQAADMQYTWDKLMENRSGLATRLPPTDYTNPIVVSFTYTNSSHYPKPIL